MDADNAEPEPELVAEADSRPSAPSPLPELSATSLTSDEEILEAKEEIPSLKAGDPNLFKTIVETVLPMQVDCLAFNHKFNILAIGAYELDTTDSDIRKGFIYLIALDSESPQGFKYLQQKATAGVLDLKWEPHQQTKLAVGTSNSILIFQVELVENRPMLESTHEVELTTMVLFVQWMNENRVIFSDSGGSVSILDAFNEEPPDIAQTNQLHDFLVWVVHYNADMNIVYTGADDGKFLAFHTDDLMTKETHFKKTFDVGVTSILTKDDLVAIGCYDDKLRIYVVTVNRAQPPGTTPIKLVQNLEINVDGAVWRTMWLPPYGEERENEYQIVVAAARNGVHIIRFNRSSWLSETLLECKTHVGSLAYGLDVQKPGEDKMYTLASCYFDNHMLHIWKFNPFRNLGEIICPPFQEKAADESSE